MSMLLSALQTVLATAISPGNLPGSNNPTGTNADPDHIKLILVIARNVIGAAALLVITLSGFRYVAAAGDPAKVAKARAGIVYALVGIVVAIVAESILFFITSRLKSVG